MAKTSSMQGKALIAAVIGGLCLACHMILDFAMSLGGGSVTQGWDSAINMIVGLYWIFMIPMVAFAAFITFFVCLKIDARIVVGAGLVLTLALIAHSACSHAPGRVLQRIGALGSVPDIEFTDCKRYPTFSDGSSFSWVANCPENEARKLLTELGMVPVSPTYRDEHPPVTGSKNNHTGRDAAVTLEEMFGSKPSVENLWFSKDGFSATYSVATNELKLSFVPYYR